MEIAIIGNELTQAGWAAHIAEGTRISWVGCPEEAPLGSLLIDLLFDGSEERIAQLQRHTGSVWVNDVPGMLRQRAAFVRINGWSGFEQAAVIEAAAPEALQPEAERFAAALGKALDWLPDRPGFVSARVLALIINEAFLALEEGVSSAADIDTAMKLGTNYPFGPFTWAERIGRSSVRTLLEQLAATDLRYTPAASL